jgi:hypothetical protein
LGPGGGRLVGAATGSLFRGTRKCEET